MSVQNLRREPPSAVGRRLPFGAVGIATAATLIVLAISIALLIERWPFTEQRVIQALKHQSQSNVQITQFRHTYFPHPGCIAEGVIFRRDPDTKLPPLIAIQRLTIRGNYLGLLAHHISQITVEGFHLTILPPGKAVTVPTTPSGAPPDTTDLEIDSLTAHGAQVEFPTNAERSTALVWTVNALSLDHVSADRPLSFRATVQNPEPPGEIRVVGQLGPWQTGHGEKTPLSGEYTFDHAELGVFQGISGVMAANGKFHGELDHIAMEGRTSVPDFEVTQAAHPVDLKTEFEALVNGVNGDVELKPVNAQFAKTSIAGLGEIEGRPEQRGKTVDIKLSSDHARVQDLLRLFVHDDPPPMVGPILFTAGVVIPPTDAPFLKKITIQGDFGIAGAQYTNRGTQKSVDIASAKARGQADKIEDDQDKDNKDGTDKTDQDLEHVVSNVKGHVVLRNGVANFSNLSFDVPGASALVSGTYNLLNQKVDLHGIVRIDAKLSQATTGVKSFLLKIVQPLASRKKNQGSIVALRVTGTYRKPSFAVTPTEHK